MANEKRTCNQMCRWNDSSDGCIKPESRPCPMSNTEPDASGWGQVKVANESTCHITSKRRLIDANALLAELDKFVNPMPDAYGLHFLNGLSTAITEIEDAPTVDAVEVKCKVGDYVYALWEAPVKLKYIIYCAEVKEIRISMRNCRLTTTYILEPIMYSGHRREYRDEDFGTLVFKEEEDAERKLYPCEHCISGTYRSCEGCSYGERREGE